MTQKLFYALTSALLYCSFSQISAGTVVTMPQHALASVRLMGEFIKDGEPGALMPRFKLYFNGNLITSDDAGAYTISVPQADIQEGILDDFSLLICRHFELEHEQGHTLIGIKIKDLSKCSWYKLDREYDEKAKGFYWRIQEQELDENSYIPERSLVVMMNNTHVVRVENPSQLDGENLLPTIVLADDPSNPGALQRASVKSELAALHLGPHARKASCRQMNHPSGVEVKMYY